jgi:hypothetical protein
MRGYFGHAVNPGMMYNSSILPAWGSWFAELLLKHLWNLKTIHVVDKLIGQCTYFSTLGTLLTAIK